MPIDSVSSSLTNTPLLTSSKNTSSGFSKKTPVDSLAEDIEEAQGEVGAYLIRIEEDGTVQYGTGGFYLASVGFSYKERVQVSEAFNSSNIAFFDESVRTYVFNCIATDYYSSDENDITKYFNQTAIIDAYNTKFRGAILFKEKAVCLFKFMNHNIYCYPFAMTVNYSAASDKYAQFTLTVVVLDHTLDNLYGLDQTAINKLQRLNKSGSNEYLKCLKDLNSLLFLKALEVKDKKGQFTRLAEVINYGVNYITPELKAYIEKEIDSILEQLFNLYQSSSEKYPSVFSNIPVYGLAPFSIPAAEKLTSSTVTLLTDVYNKLVELQNR